MKGTGYGPQRTADDWYAIVRVAHLSLPEIWQRLGAYRIADTLQLLRGLLGARRLQAGNHDFKN
jgi:hypothetical protein